MLFCPPNNQSRCRPCVTETATQNCVCKCKCDCTCEPVCPEQVSPAPPPRRRRIVQVVEEIQEQPQIVTAILNTVLDSCCTTENVCREIKVCCPDIFDPCELEVGSVIDIELADDISFKEVNRSKDDCVCVSSVRFNVPVRLFGTNKHCCKGSSIVRNLTIIKSATLCCSRDSILNTFNSRVLAASAVVSDICGHEVTITICLLFRACLQHTLLREFSWQATPVCVHADCDNANNSFADPCDLICGCSESKKTCPTC